MPKPNSLKSIFFALGANLAIFIAKLGAALFTGSGSLLAEAIHSLADTGNQLLLLWGLKLSRRPPTPKHPLGHGKAIFFWSFIVALLLFSMGGMFSIYEGFYKLKHPKTISYPFLALGVLLFSLLAEGISLIGCLKEINKVRKNQTLLTWFKKTRQSELLVVFGEDSAAIIGLTFAFLAIVLSIITQNPFYDALGSILIGILLIVIALAIGSEVYELLIGQGVEPEIKEKIIELLEKQPEIKQVLNLITLQLGPNVMVAVKAKMNLKKSALELVNDINQCEQILKRHFPQVKWIFFEPDIKK